MTVAITSFEVSAGVAPAQTYGWASTDDAVEMIDEGASTRSIVSIAGALESVTYTVDTASQAEASLLQA